MRLRTNFLSGITDVGLSNSDTTLSSPGLAQAPVVESPDYLPITLDPTGTPEVVWVVAHLSSATTGTIARAQEGTTGLSHTSGVSWVHAPTAVDFAPLRVRPADRFVLSPVPSAPTAIDLGLTVPGAAVDRFVWVSFHVEHWSGGVITTEPGSGGYPRRFTVHVDGTRVMPEWSLGYLSGAVSSGPNVAYRVDVANLAMTVPGDGSSHEVAIYAQADSEVEQTVFGYRSLTVCLD